MAKPSTPARPRAVKSARQTAQRSANSSRKRTLASRAARSNRQRPSSQPLTKLARLRALLQRKQGATIAELTAATGWQPHSVRGAISGALKKKLGLTVEIEVVEDRGRVYRIVGHG